MSEPKGSISYSNASLLNVIRRAYGVDTMQIKGPDWLTTEGYDIYAELPTETPLPQMQLMLQALLAERFKLAVHREKKKFAAYTLVVGKHGSKLNRSEGMLSYRPWRDSQGRHLRGTITMPLIATLLSDALGRPVSDRTRLNGLFEINLDYSIDDTPAPPLMEAVHQQLGLKLEPRKAALDVIVVDHVENIPTGN